MKKIRKFAVLSFSFIFALLCIGSINVLAAGKIKPTKATILSPKKTIYVYDEFELKAKITPANAEDDYLQWSIVSGSTVIRFDDKDRTGDEAEFKALKAGTAKVCCTIKGTTKKYYKTITVKKGTGSITAVGAATKSYNVGKEFELKVKKGTGVNENKLKWTIANTKIVKFDDKDRYGDDMEFKALKAGTTKITCTNTANNKKVTYTIKVTGSTTSKNKIYLVGNKTKSVKLQKDFELEVKKGSGVKEKNLKWTIANTSIVKFDDDDRYGDDMEFRAVKKGTTTITCTNTATNQKITYTVKVVAK